MALEQFLLVISEAIDSSFCLKRQMNNERYLTGSFQHGVHGEATEGTLLIDGDGIM
jgi:hypothetical protein